MAKLKVSGSASGTGTVTLIAPTTSSTRTITLLDSTSTLDATKLSGNLPAISGASLTNLPGGTPTAGQVVQVVTESDTGGSNDSGTIGWRDTHLSVSITPQYSNSKMVVMANCYIYMNNTSGECAFGLDYTRAIAGGATTGLSPSPSTSGASHWSIGNGERSVRYSHHAIDSPNTTSATTYTLRIAGSGSANTIWGWQSTADTLVVMEIKV